MSLRSLPDFPWDSLAPLTARASSHAGGLINLSVGTPVDPTPRVVQQALREHADAPGYPLTIGLPRLREAVVQWFLRRRGVPGLDQAGVIPTIGSKELVAWLPTFLGLGAGDLVAHPAIAYPTYDVGARLAGATPVPMTSLTGLGPLTSATRPKLLWLNTPGNPDGTVLGIGHLQKVVAWARQHGVIVASDECYAELDWRADRPDDDPPTTPSLLDPRVTGGDVSGLLTAYSLSKQSNLAGYRAGFLAGDPALIAAIGEVRKHAGMMMPAPVQAAMIAALDDHEHVAAQVATYRARRERLLPAAQAFGLRIDGSQAGLYLWASADEDCWRTLERLADLGILAAAGSFYGAAGARHVRIALTATDAQIEAAAQRLAGSAHG